MRNKRIVFGVMGKTRGIQRKIHGPMITVAENLGKLIASGGHILLTGGEPNPSADVPIKDAAMNGAVATGSSARRISVLPKQGRFGADWFSGTPNHLAIRTDLKNERNFINGCVPDVVIVVAGGAGTLSEVAFAFARRIPIVLVQIDGVVDTRNELLTAPLRAPNSSGLDDILEDTAKAFPVFDPTTLSQIIRHEIARGRWLTANSTLSAYNLSKALAATAVMRGFNQLPYHPSFIGTFDTYESLLNKLAV